MFYRNENLAIVNVHFITRNPDLYFYYNKIYRVSVADPLKSLYIRKLLNKTTNN